jgi:hypothetical protein
MPWGKMDDKFHRNPKVRALRRMKGGTEALGVWVLWWSWCLDDATLTGFVPDVELSRSDERAAATLVSVGLWDRVDGGYVFHDFSQYNPTPEQVERKKAMDRERLAAKRAAESGASRKNVASDIANDTQASRADSAGESLPARASQPYPTQSQPNPTSEDRAPLRVAAPPHPAAPGSFPRAIQIWCEASNGLMDFSKIRLNESKHHKGALFVLEATGGDEDEIARLAANFWADAWNRDNRIGFPYFASNLSKWESPPKPKAGKHAPAPNADDYTDEEWGVTSA